jgi:hypothetical protein
MDIKDKLIEDFAKLWLAHDGLWFQAVEQKMRPSSSTVWPGADSHP